MDKIIEFLNENLNLVRAIPNDIKTKKIVAYVKRNVVFSRNKGGSILKYKKKTDIIIAYTGGLLIKILKENLFFAKKTPSVKWNKIITEAIAEATPRPWVPYAKRQIGIPIFPVFGRINGGSSILKSFLRKNRSKRPTIAKPAIIITA
jgi:hypothetical protein